MTARHDERDPLPEEPWREASSPGMRRFALQQTETAIRAAREKRKKPATDRAGQPAELES